MSPHLSEILLCFQLWTLEILSKFVPSTADSQVSWKSVISVVLTLVEEAGKVQKFHLDLLRDCLQGSVLVHVDC